MIKLSRHGRSQAGEVGGGRQRPCRLGPAPGRPEAVPLPVYADGEPVCYGHVTVGVRSAALRLIGTPLGLGSHLPGVMPADVAARMLIRW